MSRGSGSVALPTVDDWRQGTEEDVSTIPNCFCVSCQGNKATTAVFPTKIPGFREIIVLSTSCDDCGHRDSEVSFGGEYQAKGCRATFTLEDSTVDLNRQILKSDTATVSIPILDLEIPAGTQKGVLTTIEGLLRRVQSDLSKAQPERLQLGDIDNFHRCHGVIEKIEEILEKSQGEDLDDDSPSSSFFPFDIILDDIAGNSQYENPHAPSSDPKLKVVHYRRTSSQDDLLGLKRTQICEISGSDQVPKGNLKQEPGGDSASNPNDQQVKQETFEFATSCPNCSEPTTTKMCMVNIPHFKESVIMSLVCDSCGFRSNEVKGGGGIPQHGHRITLTATSREDLAREVLKSDSAGISIPELELEMEQGGMNGVYSTVEGLLDDIFTKLSKSSGPLGFGDSAIKHHSTNNGETFSEPTKLHSRFHLFLDKLQAMKEGRLFPFTLIITDPLANSFVAPTRAMLRDLHAQKSASGEDDRSEKCSTFNDFGILIEEYKRSSEEDQRLGIKEMNTENYDDVKVNCRRTEQMEHAVSLQNRPEDFLKRGPDHPRLQFDYS